MTIRVSDTCMMQSGLPEVYMTSTREKIQKLVSEIHGKINSLNDSKSYFACEAYDHFKERAVLLLDVKDVSLEEDQKKLKLTLETAKRMTCELTNEMQLAAVCVVVVAVFLLSYVWF